MSEASSNTPISADDVAHVARLARLEISDSEVEALTKELGSILKHAASISALDLEEVPPTAHPLALSNVLRPDEARPSADRDAVLAAAPAVENDRFKVPRILDEL